jgi:Uma2 family endonuclease
VAITLDLLRRVTDQELAALSARNPGYQFERTPEGRLVVSPTGSEGGRRSGNLFGQLWLWNERDHTGVTFDSSAGFNLPDGSCRSPDASWVRRDRWESLSPEQRQGFAPLCPDVVFEVRSRSDTLTELQDKVRRYVENGALLAVLVDPDAQSVELYRPGRGPERCAGADQVSLAPELPGFSLDLRPLRDG